MDFMPKAKDTTYYNIFYVERTNAPAYFDRNLSFFAWLHVTRPKEFATDKPGNTKGGSITVLLTSCLTGLD